MICPNCGGDFADWAPKCPYCGAMNYQGAERQYMEQLEDIREDMEELPEESESHYRRHVQVALKKLLVLAAAVLAAGLAAAGLYLIWQHQEDKAYEARVLRRTEWEAEEFPQLDQWYEAGEYDRILERSYELLDENHEFNIYSWSHYQFVADYYQSYLDCLLLSQTLEEGGTPTADMAVLALRGSIFLLYDATDEKLNQQTEEWEKWGYGLTAEEVRLIQEDYRKQARQTLYEDLGLTEAQAEELYARCQTDDGYMDYAPFYDYGEQLAEQMGWED